MGAVVALHGRIPRRAGAPFVVRLTDNLDLGTAGVPYALVLDSEGQGDYRDFKAVLVRGPVRRAGLILLPAELCYLDDGDVVRINPEGGELHVLFRRRATTNSLLVTERCNSRCLMCSQPPRDINDGFLVDDLLAAIPLMDPGARAIGLTGGEITLLGPRFLQLLECLRDHLPRTELDVLTNGRLLRFLPYARRVADVGHPHLRICIPLYSDVDSRHDFVVQANGAFEETTRGILNLGRVGVPLEIRVVVHQQTYQRLPQLAEFIARCFPFVSHVALMGLEMTGYARANVEALWIDPAEYQGQISQAVEILDDAGLAVSIYNHQLCLLPPHLWSFARRSISDWKNIYMPECGGCAERERCGGFFASATFRYSRNISAIQPVSLPNFQSSATEDGAGHRRASPHA